MERVWFGFGPRRGRRPDPCEEGEGRTAVMGPSGFDLELRPQNLGKTSYAANSAWVASYFLGYERSVGSRFFSHCRPVDG